MNVEEICNKVIKQNVMPVADHLSGEDKAIWFLVGKCMREDPAIKPGKYKKRLLEVLKDEC